MIRKMTEEEARKFCEERCSFLEYKDIQEYIEDIVLYWIDLTYFFMVLR